MTIKIVVPEGEGAKTTRGIKVYTESGEEINGICRIQLDILPNEMLTATIVVNVSDIIGLDGLEGVVVVDSHGHALEGSEYD